MMKMLTLLVSNFIVVFFRIGVSIVILTSVQNKTTMKMLTSKLGLLVRIAMSMWKHHFICFHAIAQQYFTISSKWERPSLGRAASCPTAGYGLASVTGNRWGDFEENSVRVTRRAENEGVLWQDLVFNNFSSRNI